MSVFVEIREEGEERRLLDRGGFNNVLFCLMLQDLLASAENAPMLTTMLKCLRLTDKFCA